MNDYTHLSIYKYISKNLNKNWKCYVFKIYSLTHKYLKRYIAPMILVFGFWAKMQIFLQI